MINFSIIIPMYNSEKYIKKCIESILRQTFKNYELIIIDDGSKDNSSEICKQYLNNKHIKYFYKENGGVSSARNYGINKAKNKYIAFIDSDDEIPDNYLEKYYKILKEEEYDFIINTEETNKIKNVKYYTYLTKDGGIKSLKNMILQKKGINSPWSKIYKTSIINKNNIKFNEKLSIGEDLEFNLKYYNYISNLYIINEKLYNYSTDNTESLCRKYIKDKYELLNKNLPIKINLLKEIDSKTFKNIENDLIVNNIFSDLINIIARTDKETTNFEIKKRIIFLKKELKGLPIYNKNKLYYIGLKYIPTGLLCIVLKKIFKN